MITWTTPSSLHGHKLEYSMSQDIVGAGNDYTLRIHKTTQGEYTFAGISKLMTVWGCSDYGFRDARTCITLEDAKKVGEEIVRGRFNLDAISRNEQILAKKLKYAAYNLDGRGQALPSMFGGRGQDNFDTVEQAKEWVDSQGSGRWRVIQNGMGICQHAADGTGTWFHWSKPAIVR